VCPLDRLPVRVQTAPVLGAAHWVVTAPLCLVTGAPCYCTLSGSGHRIFI
jgi:hypothetical protein